MPRFRDLFKSSLKQWVYVAANVTVKACPRCGVMIMDELNSHGQPIHGFMLEHQKKFHNS